MSYTKMTVTPDTSGTMWIGGTTGTVPWEDIVATESVAGAKITLTPTGPIYSVSTPKGKTLVAKTRLNRGTMEGAEAEYIKNVVKHRLVKELLQQLIDSGVVKITSDVSTKGAVTFTATVVVNETP